MYNLEEIKLQNQHDCYSRMYMFVADSINDIGGRKAEGVLREAVRRFGEDRGDTLREQHIKENIKTNLYSLFAKGGDAGHDPRFRQEIIREDSQVRIWEVFTCPMADMWNKNGKSKIGSCYCEEFMHAYVKAYTKGKGQTNISTILTCPRDNHCRFSEYYRPANLDEEQKKQSFEENEQDSNLKAAVKNEKEFKKAVNMMFIKLYYYLLGTAKEKMGDDGVSAVAIGLRKLAVASAEILKIQADHTGNPVNEAFVDRNFPLLLNTDDEPLWKQYDKNEAKTILKTSYLDPLKAYLEL